jgi:hypothetical protein
MVGVDVAAVAASMDLDTTSIRGTGNIGFTCAGWGKEEWDSDELPELIYINGLKILLLYSYLRNLGRGTFFF